ncbi:MAG: response regulator [Planctomycetes bacterium]|nr:response regulator [Planctomycetota bacterium]
MNENSSKLLVVDDNEMNRDMLSRRLSRRNHTVKTAENGQQALDLIDKESFDVILLDIMMPGISGIEVLKIIRQFYSASELPVIMVTAKGDSDDVVTALKLGANDYVIKPLDLPVVLARVQTQLEASCSHKTLKKRTKELEAMISDSFTKIDSEQLRSLIDAGENDRFELKSTLRWNLKSNKPGKEIENAWLKTIIAFLNTDGGLLLIGVEDDGNVLGLEPDKFPNADRYLLHVNNLIREHIGMEVIQFIKFGLKQLDGKEILCIQCSPSLEPAFLKNNKDEDFYIRVGPGSRKLTSRETLIYINNRKMQTPPGDSNFSSEANGPIL